MGGAEEKKKIGETIKNTCNTTTYAADFLRILDPKKIRNKSGNSPPRRPLGASGIWRQG